MGNNRIGMKSTKQGYVLMILTLCNPHARVLQMPSSSSTVTQELHHTTKATVLSSLAVEIEKLSNNVSLFFLTFDTD